MLPPLTIFDIETTGLDPRRGHRIIEIAGVRLENGRLLTESAFATFVNPEREIPIEAQRINKISDKDVQNAPTIDVALPRFLDFAAGSILFAHNAEFDMGFLEVEKEFCWGYVDLPECFCTMKFSKNLFPSDFRYSLDVLCKRFNMELPPMRHRALADAVLTGEILLKLLQSGNVSSIDELRKRAGMRQLVP